MDISRLLNPVVDREVDMSVETHSEPERSNTSNAPEKERMPLPSSPLAQTSAEDEEFIAKIGVRRWACPFCPRICPTRSKVHRHINGVHLDLRPFQCLKCSKAFHAKADLKMHMNAVHLDVRPFPCLACGKGYQGPGALEKHISSNKWCQAMLKEETHMEHEPSAACLAPESDNSHLPLLAHEPKPTEASIWVEEIGDNQYACSRCSRIFSRREHARRHINAVHLGLRPFPCLVCGKAFKNKYDLTVHNDSCRPLEPALTNPTLGLGERSEPTSSLEQSSRSQAEFIAGQALLALRESS